jgi:hypothetical protein
VTDGGGATASDTFVLTVNAVNDLPTISNIANQVTNEDVPIGSLPFTVGDLETAAGSLVVSATSSNTTLVPNANLVLGGSDASRTLTVTPAANQFGSTTIVVTVTDSNSGSASDTILLTVNAVNDAPLAANDAANTSGATPVVIAVLANDSDVENSPLAVSLVSSPANGTAIVNADGTVTYTANANFGGIDSFTYKANDGAADSNAATVTVTVAATAKFFVVDSSADRVFRYQANGGYLSQAALATGNTSSRGMAANADGSRLWVLDNNDTVYVYDSSLALLGSWTANGLRTPTGISVSGADVWIVDSGNDRVYRYGGQATRLSGSTAATQSFPLAASNGSPQDLITDGTTIWVTQSSGADRVFVYQASNGTALGNWTIDNANTSPIGITLDPSGASQSLWIVDNSADRVFEYAGARSRRSGSQAASVSFSLNASNGSAQGIADPRSLDSLTPAAEAARDQVFASDSWAAEAQTGALMNFFAKRRGQKVRC